MAEWNHSRARSGLHSVENACSIDHRYTKILKKLGCYKKTQNGGGNELTWTPVSKNTAGGGCRQFVSGWRYGDLRGMVTMAQIRYVGCSIYLLMPPGKRRRLCDFAATGGCAIRNPTLRFVFQLRRPRSVKAQSRDARSSYVIARHGTQQKSEDGKKKLTAR